jgi:hypothetical protein
MAKNLVVIHLESISQSILWHYRVEMPALMALCVKSASFRRFYASGTSTVLSMSGFLYGNSSEMDHLPSFGVNAIPLKRGAHLYAVLARHGYEIMGSLYFPYDPGHCATSLLSRWEAPSVPPFSAHNDFNAMGEAVAAFIDKSARRDRPFALYFWNMAPHGLIESPHNPKSASFTERMASAYMQLDSTIQALWNILESRGLLADTTIAAYGDHGDDLYGHGFSQGYLHGNGPYATVSWTPLFLYNAGFPAGETDQIASIVDVKPTLLEALGVPDAATERPPFSGMRLGSQIRTLAFTQNRFALQRETNAPDWPAKAYAVTDGQLRLVVAACDAEGGYGGLELFHDQMDPGNQCNLLDFFELDAEGNIASCLRRDKIGMYFFHLFNPRAVQELRERHAFLRKELLTHVREKERAAMAVSGGEANFLPAKAFMIKRPPRMPLGE